ncbi:hypothetical protein D9M68_341270 [compost metagenome]
MKTGIIEAGGLLSVLSARGVEKQLARLPGVTRAEVNGVSGSTTVEYDETVIPLSDIKAFAISRTHDSIRLDLWKCTS